LFREIITEEKRWLDVNDTTFEKLMAICKIAQLNKNKELDPEEIMGIIRKRIEEKRC
jgi:hypothetical protein